MATHRENLVGLWKESDHPQLAIEHLAPFSHPAVSGQKQSHLRDVLNKSTWGTLLPEYRQAFDRRMAALDEFRGGFEGGTTRFSKVTLTGRLAAGLGNASVMENGLSLNHAYGLPMLAGSGLKGLASAMAHLGLEADSWRMGTPENNFEDQGEDHRALFGDRDTGRQEASGGMVVFHDAWWEPAKGETKPPFELDVITPHQGDAYYLKGEAWPNDWTDPRPSPFLTVRGAFIVPLSGPKAWVQAAGEILEQAFQHQGFGAKTQIGYGRGTWEPWTPPVVAQEATATARLFRIPQNAGYQPDQVGSFEVELENGTRLKVSKRQVEAFLPAPSSGQRNRMQNQGLTVLCTYMPGEFTPRSLALPQS